MKGHHLGQSGLSNDALDEHAVNRPVQIFHYGRDAKVTHESPRMPSSKKVLHQTSF
jgi:hypothetical protein